MDEAIHSENAERRRKSFILAIITTMIVIYAAVPAYGIIRDIAAGEHVFVLRSNLPGVEMERPGLGFAGKVYRFFFPQKEVPVPVAQPINLKGRVVYTDGTPFPGGLIEFRTDPRYTRTDNRGSFMFIDVDEGAHTISVLDDAGNVLATCQIYIERTLEATGVVLVRLSDGTFVFHVPGEVLEITIFLQKGDDGKVTGIDRIIPGPAEDTQEPTNPAGPANPPVNPDTPPNPPGGGGSGGGGGGGGGGADPSPSGFGVFDTATTTSYGTAGAVDVNIFGAGKRLAPGMSGSYKFTVDNTGNKYAALYDVTFTVKDTLPADKKIPMLFRLKADGVYVAGNKKTWCTPAELYQDTDVMGGRDVEYTLEWYWPQGDNDNAYAAFGGNPDFSYGLMITVTAQAD